MFLKPSEDDEADRDLREGLANVSPETLRRFVVVAVLVQAGLFAASLGVMLAWFRGQRAVGGALVVGGAAALAISVAVYQRQKGSS